jgi:ParB-like chromosome segregation protein Spo0J
MTTIETATIATIATAAAATKAPKAEKAPKADKAAKAPKATAGEAPQPTNGRISPESLTVIGLDTREGAENVLWDERATQPLRDEFVANVKALGVIEPVIAIERGDALVVVAGRQRVKAARKAGLDTVPVVVLPADTSASALAQIGVAENEARQNDGIPVKAAKVARLKKLGVSTAKIAVAFAVSDQAIRDWLDFDKCAPEVKAAVEAGTVKPTGALKIARMGDFELQIAALAEALRIHAERLEAIGGGDEAVSAATAALAVRNLKKGGDDEGEGEDEDEGEGGAKKAKKAKKEADKEASRPTMRQIKKLIDVIEAGLAPQFDGDFVNALRFVAGLKNPKAIKGLAKALATELPDEE